jgi:hypothetical protein
MSRHVSKNPKHGISLKSVRWESCCYNRMGRRTWRGKQSLLTLWTNLKMDKPLKQNRQWQALKSCTSLQNQPIYGDIRRPFKRWLWYVAWQPNPWREWENVCGAVCVRARAMCVVCARERARGVCVWCSVCVCVCGAVCVCVCGAVCVCVVQCVCVCVWCCVCVCGAVCVCVVGLLYVVLCVCVCHLTILSTANIT